MIRLHTIAIFLVAVFLAGCLKKDIEPNTPDCIIDNIRSFKQSGCDDQSVSKYVFQGRDVYVFGAGTCGADMQSDVFDGDCKLLGSLGGFTGNTKINGVEFRDEAEFVVVIWKKD